jgi:hypothetical protein
MSADATRLANRLRLVRVAAVAFALAAFVPVFAEWKEPMASPSINMVFANMLVPAVIVALGAMLCKAKPGLLGVSFAGALILLLIASAAKDAMGDVHYAGWAPVYWAGVLTVLQALFLATVVYAFLAGAGGSPGQYVLALGGALSPFFVWGFLAPMHGWAGHGVARNDNRARDYVRSLAGCLGAHAGAFAGAYPRTLADLGSPSELGLGGCGGLEDALRGAGYQVSYAPRDPDASGRLRAYRLTARPLRYQRTAMTSYLVENGVITRTFDDREAQPADDLMK